MTAADAPPSKVAEALRVMELSEGATLPEIRRSYRFLMDLYGSDSLATIPLTGEMEAEDRRRIVAEIESAYETLVRFFEDDRNRGRPQARSNSSEVRRYMENAPRISGEVLKTVRQMRGFDLQEAAAETRIPVQELSRIEEEDFAALPPPVYTRGFVCGYAGFLGVDVERTASDFMALYREWEKAGSARRKSGRFRLAFWRKR